MISSQDDDGYDTHTQTHSLTQVHTKQCKPLINASKCKEGISILIRNTLSLCMQHNRTQERLNTNNP